MLEDFLIYLGRRVGLTQWWWCYVGYLTTWAWFALSLPIWLEPVIQAGFTTDALPARETKCDRFNAASILQDSLSVHVDTFWDIFIGFTFLSFEI